MDKNEYLLRLAGALSELSKAERDQYLDYYSELISDRMEEGLTEEQAVAELESVYAAAERIKAESGISTKKSLSAGAIVAIVFGSLVLLFILVVLIGSLVYGSKPLVSSPPVSEPVSPPSESLSPGQSPAPAESAEGTSYMEQRFSADVNFIEIEAIENHVSILPSQDRDFHLHYYSTHSATLEYKEKDGAVSLKDPKYRDWDFSLSVIPSSQRPENTIVLYVPAGSLPTVEISLISGALEVKNTSLDELSFAGVAGDLELEGVELSNIYVGTVSGSLDMDDCIVNSIDFASTSSGVDLDKVKVKAINIANVSGNVELEETSFDILSMATVSGNLKGSLLGDPGDYGVSFDSLSGRSTLGTSLSGSSLIEFASVSGSLLLEFDRD